MLKLVLTLVVVFIALAWWNRRRSGPVASAQRGAPQRMVSCACCGVHLPLADALGGEAGPHFCGVEHQRLGPRAGPPP